jgi:hypothetical protein
MAEPRGDLDGGHKRKQGSRGCAEKAISKSTPTSDYGVRKSSGRLKEEQQ